MALNPVTYHWKQDDGYTHIGFLAQELETVIPEVVRAPKELTASPEGSRQSDTTQTAYAVNYAEIIPVLVKAVQEQQVIIRILEQRIAELEK